MDILTETEVYGGWWMIFKDRTVNVEVFIGIIMSGSMNIVVNYKAEALSIF